MAIKVTAFYNTIQYVNVAVENVFVLKNNNEKLNSKRKKMVITV